MCVCVCVNVYTYMYIIVNITVYLLLIKYLFCTPFEISYYVLFERIQILNLESI